jgi:hypothetical protein
MPEPGATAAAVLAQIGRLTERERLRLMQALESVPAEKLAGFVVLPRDVHDTAMDAYSAMLRILREGLFRALGLADTVLKSYRSGPRTARKRREERDTLISQALSNGISNEEEILQFVALHASDPRITKKGKKGRGSIDAHCMMKNYYSRQRRTD